MTSPYPGTAEAFDAWPPERLLAIAEGLRPEAVAAEAEFHRAAHAVFVQVADGLLAARGRLAGERGTAADGALAELARLDLLAAQARERMRSGVEALGDHATQVAAARSEIGSVRAGSAFAHGAAGALDPVVGTTIDDAAKWFVIDNVHRYQAVSNANYTSTYPVHEAPDASPVRPAPAGSGPGGSGGPGHGPVATPPAADMSGTGVPGGATPGAVAPPGLGLPPGGSTSPAAVPPPGSPSGAGVPPGGAVPPGGTPAPDGDPGGGTAAGEVDPPGGVLPPAGALPGGALLPGALPPGGPVPPGGGTPRTPMGRRPDAAAPSDGAWRHPHLDGPAGRPPGPAAPVPPRDGPGAAARSAAAPASPSPVGRTGAPGVGGVPLAGVGAGRGEESRQRPSWLLEDDPEAVWFAGLPEHCAPVVSVDPGPHPGPRY